MVCDGWFDQRFAEGKLCTRVLVLSCSGVFVCVFVVVVEDRGWVGALGAAESLPGEKSVIEVIKHFRCWRENLHGYNWTVVRNSSMMSSAWPFNSESFYLILSSWKTIWSQTLFPAHHSYTVSFSHIRTDKHKTRQKWLKVTIRLCVLFIYCCKFIFSC